MTGFIDFVRKQGVVGLAIGFMLGAAISKLTASFVVDIINPLLAAIFNAESLRANTAQVGTATVMWGNFLATAIDFAVVAAVIYFGFKLLRLDRLDKKE